MLLNSKVVRGLFNNVSRLTGRVPGIYVPPADVPASSLTCPKANPPQAAAPFRPTILEPVTVGGAMALFTI